MNINRMGRWLLGVSLMGLLISPVVAAGQEGDKDKGHEGHGHEGHAHADGDKGEHGEMDHAAMEKMWEEFSKTGPAHEEFKKRAGKWKTETKDFWTNPADPAVSYGTATFKTILGGRYLTEEVKGEAHGKPFEGFGLLAYDNALNKYVHIWADSMSTAVMRSEGVRDEATKTTTFTAEMASPMGPMKMRMVSKEIDDNKSIFTMYFTMGDGNEMKGMEITYTRM